MSIAASCTTKVILMLSMLMLSGVASTQIYQYDSIGRLTNVSYPSGASISYRYDANSNVTRIEHNDGAVLLPPDGVIDTPADDSTISVGDSVDFNGAGGDPDGALPLTYRWDFDGGAAESLMEDPGPVVFNTVGTYTVEFFVTDATALTDPTPDSVVITVEAATPPVNPPQPQTKGGSVLWLPLVLFLVVLRRLGRRALGAIAVTALVVSAGVAQAADWTPMNSPTSAHLKDVWGTSSDAVFAVGANGTILFFDGSSWSPMNSGVTAWLFAVFGYSDTDVYAVGELGTVLHYDGATWTPIDIGAGTNGLVDVWSAGPGEPLYVLGGNRAWYFDGSNWVQQPFTEGFSVSLTATTSLTGIGGTSAYVVTTGIRVGGTIRSMYVNFRDTLQAQAQAVWAFNDNEMFVVGQDSYRLNGGLPTDSSTGNWRPIPVQMQAPLNVWGSAPNNMFSVGHHGTTGRIVHYDGNVNESWDVQYEVPSSRLTSVFGFGSTDVFVVGYNGTILRYVEPPPPDTAANFPYSGMFSPHVNAHTGELVLEEQDFKLGQLIPVTLERYYASGLLSDGRVGGSLGRNWTHTYEWSLHRGNNNGVTEITILTNRGRQITFEGIGADWDLVSPLSTAFTLRETPAEFLFADPQSERILRFDKVTDTLASIEDRNGNRISLTYQGGLLRSVASSSNEIRFDYSGANDLTGIYTLGDPASNEPRYDIAFEFTNGNLTKVTDAGGLETLYEYAPGRETEALLEAVVLPSVTQRRWFYDGENKVVEEQVSATGSFEYAYGATQSFASNPDGAVRRIEHDANGAATLFEDELGYGRSYQYDSDGRPTSYVDRIGRTTSWTYLPGTAQIATTTRPDALVYTYTYEQNSSAAGIPFFDLTRVENPDLTLVTTEYDSNGNITAWTDQEGNTWRYTHTPRGEVETVTNPLSGVTQHTYWSHGGQRTITDQAGNVTAFGYDGFNRPVTTGYADGSSKSIVWNERSDISQITTEMGEVTDFQYLVNGLLGSVSNSSGAVTQYTYDSFGNVQTTVRLQPGMADAVTTTAYDDFGRTAFVTAPDGTTLAYDYDAIGQVNAITDGQGEVWAINKDAEGTTKSIVYPGNDALTFDNSDNALRLNTRVTEGNEVVSRQLDFMARLIGVADATESTTVIGRDRRGLITSVTTPEPGIMTTHEHNALGQVTKTTDPNGGEWDKGFDSQGRVTSYTDPLNRVALFEYDSRNRPDRVAFPDGAGDATFTYDANSQVVRQTYSDGTQIDLGHDSRGRPVSGDGVTLDYNARNKITNSNGITIDYDSNDRIRRINLPAGRFIEYQYDARGHLQQVTDWLGGTTVIARTASGRTESVTLPNGIANGYVYDRAGRVTGITHGSIGTIALQRDVRGFVTMADRNLPGPQAIEPDVRVYDFDAASQVTRFQYNPLGYVSQDDERSYSFNLAGQLKSYEGENGTVTLTYDALNKPVSSSRVGRSRDYVWNYSLGKERIAIEREAGLDLWYYVYTTSGRLLYRINGDGVRQHYHFDELGNTVFMTDDGGTVIATYFYSPFGETLDESGAVDNDRKFGAETGGQELTETSINYRDGEFVNSINATAMKRVEPVDDKTYTHANDAIGKPENYSGDSIGNDIVAIVPTGFDLSVQWFISQMSGYAPGVSVLDDIVVGATRAASHTLNFVNGIYSGVQAGLNNRRLRTEESKAILAGGVAVYNVALGLHPLTAVAVVGANATDAFSKRLLGIEIGYTKAFIELPVELAATTYDVASGRGGRGSYRRFAKAVENAGVIGKLTTVYAEYNLVSGLAGSLMSWWDGESKRTKYLEYCIKHPDECRQYQR